MLKVLLAVLVIALVVYGVTRLIERRGLPRPTRREPPRPVAPDDDPDFLWRLEAERRRRAKRDDATEPQDEAPDEDSTGTT